MILPGEIQAGGAHAAADIENIQAIFYASQIGEVLDQLYLGGLFGLLAGNPESVVKMFAPECSIVGADYIVVFNDFDFVVRTIDCVHTPSIYTVFELGAYCTQAQSQSKGITGQGGRKGATSLGEVY